jgi:hypothetical protein
MYLSTAPATSKYPFQAYATHPTPPKAWKLRKSVLPAQAEMEKLNKSILRGNAKAPGKWKDIVLYGAAKSYKYMVFYAEGGRWINLKAVHAGNLEREVSRARGEKLPQNKQIASTQSLSNPSTVKARTYDEKRSLRGDIKCLSKRAARRLKEATCKIDRGKAPYFSWLRVTLTMPASVSDAYKLLEKTFAYMKKKLRLELVGLWRKEWQERGVEHFHLDVHIPTSTPLTETFIAGFRQELIQNWSRRIKYQSGHAVSHKACSVTQFADDDALEALGRYDSKTSQDVTSTQVQQGADPLPGRRWGILNKKGYHKLTTIKVVELNPKVYWTLRRKLRKLINDCLRSNPNGPKRYNPSPYKIDEQYMFMETLAVPRLITTAENYTLARAGFQAANCARFLSKWLPDPP